MNLQIVVDKVVKNGFLFVDWFTAKYANQRNNFSGEFLCNTLAENRGNFDEEYE